MLALLSQLGQRLPQSLLLSEGFSSLGFEVAEFALEEVNASAVFLLLLLDLSLQLRERFFGHGALKRQLVG